MRFDNNYLLAVCSCIRSDAPEHANLFQKIEQKFSRFVLSIKRLFYSIRFGERLTNLKARKIVKGYIWNAKPTDKTAVRDKIIHAIFKKIDHIKRRDGKYSDGLDSMWISETFENSDTKTFRRVKKLDTADNRLLLHIHGDEFGANNESLEGHQSLLTLGYLHAFLKNRKKAGLPLYGLSDELLKELSDGLKLEKSKNFVQDAQERIDESFSKKQNLFLVGGWIGSPGHAMYYEVIPDDSNTATLRLYNLGGGSNNHVYGRVGYKTKALPYVDFKRIEKNRLKDHHVLRALREINQHINFPNSDTKTEYNEADIYHGLKSLLDAEMVMPDEKDIDVSELKTTQRSGVCAWKSLMAFLAVRLKKEEYKKFVCDVKLQSLSDRVRILRNGSFKHVDWRLVNKSHRKLSRKVTKEYRAGRIGKKYLSQAQYELRKVELWLERTRETALKAQSKSGNFKQKEWDERTLDLDYVSSNKSSLFQEVEKETSAGSLQPNSPVERRLRGLLAELKQANATTIPNVLNAVNIEVKRAFDAGEHDAIDLGVFEFIKSIPLEKDSSFFGTAIGNNPQVAEQTVIELSNLVKVYFENCFRVSKSEVVSIERRYVLKKLLENMQRLSKVIKPGSKINEILFNVKGSYKPKIYDYSNDPQICRDLKIIDGRYQGIITFYHFKNHQPVGKSSFLNFSHDSKFGQLLLDAFPDVVKKIKGEDPEYSSDKHVKRQAKVFSSKYLPDWFKGIRDTYLYLCHLENEPVANPTSKKIDVSLDFNLKLEKDFANRDYCEVLFSVKGVTGDILKDYPEIARERKNPEYRYEGLHRRIKSDPLRKCLGYVMDRSGNDEKITLADHVRNHGINMSDESFKEIVHLFLRNPHWIPETIAYFHKHPAKIRDPDYQVMFEILLFLEESHSDHGLEEQFKVKGFATLLGNYFLKEYNQAIAENSIPTAVFFLRMQRLCSPFSPKEPLFKGTNERLRGILKSNGLAPAVKSVVYAELVAALSQKEALDEQDIEDLLVGSAYVKENPISENWEVPQTTRQIREAFHRHAEQIENALGQGGGVNQELINKVFKTLRGEQSLKWTAKSQNGQFPTYESADGKHKYCPQEGRIHTRDAQVNIPEDILNHPHYRQVFPKVTRGILKSDTVYQVMSPEGYTTLLKRHKGELTIEQKRNGEWLRFIDRKAFAKSIEKIKVAADGTSLGSRYILESCTHWHSLKDPSVIKISDNTTGKVQYEAALKNGKVQGVKKVGENAWLGKANQLFEHFEHLPYVQEWYQASSLFAEHCLRSVELPRFGLSFNPDSKDVDKLYCDQFKEGSFYVSKTQSHPSLGSYPHALVLENDKGQVKILLPKQKFLPPEEKESLEHCFEIDRKISAEDSEKQEYLTYDLDKNGEFKAQNRTGYIYLAYVLTAVHEYERAAKVLNKYAPKLSSYSREEFDYLEKLAKLGEITGDIDANAHALKLFSQSLLLRSMMYSQTQVKEKFLNLLVENCKAYLSHYHNVTALRLKKEDELFVIKVILSQTFDAQLFLRLKELDPGYAKDYTMPKKDDKSKPAEVHPSFKQVFSEASFINSCHNRHIEENKNSIDLDKMLLTRASVHISKNFYAFYDIAKRGSSSEKKWLREAIAFNSHPSQKGSGWVLLMSCIYDHPEKFPEVPVNRKELAAWWHKVLEIADQVDAGRISNFIKKADTNREEKDLTPADYRLIDAVEKTPSVKIHLGFKTQTSFKSLCEKENLFQETVVEEKNGTDLHAWLVKEQENPVSQEPMYANECKRLGKDFSVYKANSKETIYTLSDVKIHSTAKLLEAGKQKTEKEIKELGVEILELANKLPAKAEDAAQRKLSQSGKLERPLTMEELFVYFARRQPGVLKQRNGSLTDSEINQIFDKVGKYLILSTHEQQRARAQTTFDKLKKSEDAKEKRDLIQQLALDLLSGRHYVPAKNPAYLVFEYYAGILMRKEQVEKLEKFLHSGDTNPIMEMIMGSGKSKVLLPLLGLLRADGKILSTLIVPHALFESVSSDTYRILDDAFSQSLKAFHFNRNTVFTEQSLEMILSDLKSVVENRECVIMTSKSIQCFLLKYIEKCDQYIKTDEYSKELQLMQQILALLGNVGYPLIDEADTVLNILHEVCFSAGDKRSPDTNESQVVAAIYDILYNDAEIKALAKVESDPKPDKTAPVFTEALYNTSIKPRLANKFIEKMRSVTFESQERTHEVQNFFKNLTSEDRKNVKHYLTHEESHKKEAQTFYDLQSELVKDILALAGEQISEFLVHTLSRTCEEKYGLDLEHGLAIAIPYSAANTPSVSSQFANAYITMNYTYQYYCKKGVNREVVLLQWERLQSEAIKELKEGGAGTTLQDTEAWKKFSNLIGDVDVPFFNFKMEHLDKVTNCINSDTKRIQGFVRDFILPQLDLYSKKLSCNPHNLVELFAKVSGFTGTLWNSKSMHRKTTAAPEAGTDAKTIHLLWKYSRDEVYTIEEGSPEKMLDQIEKANLSYDMISDAGGYFKEGGNKNIAEILERKKNVPVAFYNKKNEQAILNKGNESLLSDSSVSMEGRVTFLDQSHTTGADVPQKRDAVGIVTISRNMLLRDLLQSVWRLRGLAKSQRVKFVITKEVEAIIRQVTGNKNGKIRFDELLRFVMINQTKQQGKDNFKALRQELTNVPQALLLKVLISDTFSLDQKKQVFRCLSGEWIKPSDKRPSAIYGTLTYQEDSSIVLENEKQRYLQQIEGVFEQLPFLEGNGFSLQNEKNTINEIVNRMKDSLAAKVTVPLRDMDDDQTVEIEQETQTETETELEVQEYSEKEKVKLGLYYWNKIERINQFNQDMFNKQIHSFSVPYFSLKTYLEQDEKLRKFSEAFEGISLTLNVLEWPEDDPRVIDLQLFGSHRTPFHFVKVQDDGEVILLSQNDTANYKVESLYNLTLGYYDQKRKVSDDILKKIVKIKFLNGESSYTKRELNLLSTWILEQGVEEMLEFYQKHILAGFPDKAADYCQSRLNDLFKKLMRK